MKIDINGTEKKIKLTLAVSSARLTSLPGDPSWTATEGTLSPALMKVGAKVRKERESEAVWRVARVRAGRIIA